LFIYVYALFTHLVIQIIKRSFFFPVLLKHKTEFLVRSAAIGQLEMKNADYGGVADPDLRYFGKLDTDPDPH
jgi:hypothetical protein